MGAVLPPAEPVRRIPSGLRHLSRRALLAGVIYECAVVAAATGAAVTHEPGYWLALLGLTLICGLPAFVGVYIFYGLLTTLGTALGAHMSTGDYGPPWFVVCDGIIDVILFAGAGAVNIVLVRQLAGRFAGRRGSRARRRVLSVLGITDTTRYHMVMAMTLRLSSEQTEALRRKAEAEHRSMQQVALAAIDAYVHQATPARRQSVPVMELMTVFQDLPPMSAETFRADQDRYADGKAHFDAYTRLHEPENSE